MMYVEFTVSQTMEHFLGCHQNAFEWFGAVPGKVMVDNLKSAVLKRIVGKDPIFNPKYLDFANHHGFTIVPCGVGKGNEKGRVTGMECIKMELGEPDDSGRRRPVPVDSSKFKLESDLAVIAVGAGPNPLLTQSTEGLKLNRWGYIETDPETGKTSKKGVWAGGDIVTGSATVILAMGAGRQASDSIHNYLTLGW